MIGMSGNWNQRQKLVFSGALLLLMMLVEASSIAETDQACYSEASELKQQLQNQELELEKLRSQLKEQIPLTPPFSPSGGEGANEKSQKNPWVDVNISKPPVPDSDQPAITSPSESLKTSIQYYRNQYLLRPGDKLSINLLGGDPIRITKNETDEDDNYGSSFEGIAILTDGTIIFPPLGMIQASGKTVEQLNSELSEAIAKFYRFAIIDVSLYETVAKP